MQYVVVVEAKQIKCELEGLRPRLVGADVLTGDAEVDSNVMVGDRGLEVLPVDVRHYADRAIHRGQEIYGIWQERRQLPVREDLLAERVQVEVCAEMASCVLEGSVFQDSLSDEGRPSGGRACIGKDRRPVLTDRAGAGRMTGRSILIDRLADRADHRIVFFDDGSVEVKQDSLRPHHTNHPCLPRVRLSGSAGPVTPSDRRSLLDGAQGQAK